MRFIVAIATATLLLSIDALAQEPDITAFIHQTYFEGIAYDDVSRFDPDTAVPILLTLLRDPKEEEYWTNIVVALGMLGDVRAIDPLIDFLEQDHGGRLSPPQYLAKSAVVITLGYIIQKSRNEKALAFLIDGADPQSWTRRGLRWSSPYHRTEAERNRQLSAMAILGLGLSGHPDAAKHLRSLKQESASRGLDDGAIQEALKANAEIARKGMALYDRRAHTRPY